MVNKLVSVTENTLNRLKMKRHGMINTYDLVINELLDKDEQKNII